MSEIRAGDRRRRVLVVAYYFPPMGGSGVQRVAKLVKYLPEFGWDPVVLTPEPGGYWAYDEQLLQEVEASGVKIHRTVSWDPTRLFGRATQVALPDESRRRLVSELSQFVFIPDNKIGWLPHAVQAGRRLLRTQPFDAIFSTAPPYSAHLIAALLSRWSGLALTTDFRDDWTGNPRHVYPTRLHRWVHERLERWVLRRSARVLTINEPIQESLRRGVPEQAGRVLIWPQGYDPADVEQPPVPKPPGVCRFVYSGMFYDAQTPDFFLRALARLFERNPEARTKVEAVFVGLLPEDSKRLVDTLGLSDVVQHTGYVDHPEAVRHLLAADVLWMTIGRRLGADGISTSKLFEYMGARKPILALVPPGAAADALGPYGAAYLAPPDDVAAISETLEGVLERWRTNRLPTPNEAYVETFDRRALAGRLAHILRAVLRA